VTSPHWQAVLAGARKAGQDLGVNVVELGAQSENDASAQISILETAVASNPAAIVIAPTQFAALGKPIDEAAKRVKIIGLESAADTKAMTSLLATDNVNAGRIAADALAAAITKSFADTEGDIAVITSMPGVASLDQRAKGFKDVVAAKYRALNVAADKVADGKPASVREIMKDSSPRTATYVVYSLRIQSRRRPWPKPYPRKRLAIRSISSPSARTKISSSSCRAM